VSKYNDHDIYLAGDFNINLLTWQKNRIALEFISIMFGGDLFQLY